MAPTRSQSDASSIACLACRDRHSKCDAARPQCSRCMKDTRECVYVASRRGHRATRPPRLFSVRSQAHHRVAESSTHTPEADFASFTPPASTGSDSVPTLFSASVQCHIGLYFRHFHQAHPFLLPQRLIDISPWPHYLLKVVCLIGSHFCVRRHAVDAISLMDCALAECTDQTIEVVQARLLGAIFLHAMALPECAEIQLGQAVRLAYELGLNHECFAATRDLISPLLAESARRTWWELYVVGGLFSSFRHKPPFVQNLSQVDTFLPCDEKAYEDALIPKSILSCHHLRRRILMEEMAVSSYALRVEAVGILNRVSLANNPTGGFDAENLHGLNGLLSTWVSCLPEDKTNPVGIDGNCDHMLFQAQMIIFAASILLHLPRSGNFSFRSSTNVACAKANQQLSTFLTLNMHATKVMNASHHLSVLASLDLIGQSHTPFFVCALVIVAIVQLSAIAIHADDAPDTQFDRLNLVLGLLKREAKTWPLAAKTYAQLKDVASAGCNVTAESQVPLEISFSIEDMEALFEHTWAMHCDVPQDGLMAGEIQRPS